MRAGEQNDEENTPNPAPKRVVIVGGSVAGLFAALALSRQGHHITLLEDEVLPRCDSPLEAFERWERRGAPQSRHSHAFLARLHNGIRDRTPELYADLMEAGAETLRFADLVQAAFENPEFVPEDDEIVLLACRRITLDWVLRRHVEKTTDAAYRDGVAVTGLVARRDEASGLPRVEGVRIEHDSGERETLPADLVVDASGRNTQLADWLEEIGSRPLEKDSESCGIFYCSRYYRIRDGVDPPALEGPIGGDLGYLKYAILLGDSRIFSITLAASPADAPLRKVREAEIFQLVALSLPSIGPWVDPAVAEPITEVYTYANLKNTLRHFVPGGEPLALGIYPIGDALMHQNPISGRGCTAAWISAWLLADLYAKHADDPLALAREMDAGVRHQLVPWYANALEQDRAARERGEVDSRGEDPFAFQREDGSIDPKAYMRSLLVEGLIPALREDIVVTRAFMRVFNMLDDPRDLMGAPDLLGRVMAVWGRRKQREPLRLGPGRSEMVEKIAAATG
jgi:flavin-dependent dehydrogenase